MSGASMWEGRAVVEEIIQALGDDVASESEAWWQYALAVKDLGPDCARQLVGEVSAVEAAGGMTTRDGSRRRTRGGVFFVLAYQRLGSRRAKSVRWRATRRVHEEALRRFLRLLALAPVASATAAVPAAIARSAKLVPPGREPAATAPATKPEPSTPEPAAAKPVPAAKALPPKPTRRQEPEVEVLVVRRRPSPPA